MSYGAAAALQSAVFAALSDNSALSGFVSGAIFDAEPAGVLPETYVSIGPEKVRSASDGSAGGAVHEISISVVTEEAGFAGAKTVAAAISDILVDADLPLSRGRLVSLRFLKAKAMRDDVGSNRRIDLSFRARIDDGS